MKLLLIRPPFVVEKFYFPRFINESLAIESLAAFIAPYHEVEVLDTVAEGWNNYWEKKEYLRAIFQGMKPKKILDRIVKSRPDAIGINWFFSTQNAGLNLIINLIRQFDKNIPIIVGGSHPSANPAEALKENLDIDMVVYGEGELTLKEILDQHCQNLEKIDGLAYKKNGQIIVNHPRKLITDLDSLPIPKRQLFLHANYSRQNLYQALYLRLKKFGFSSKTNLWLTKTLSSLPFLSRWYYKFYNLRHHRQHLPAADILSSRGCPNRCTFCAVHNVWGHTWRMRSAKSVLDEIDILVKKFGVKHINIQDDNFNVSKKRALEICQGIVKNNYQITLTVPAFMPTLDEETLVWFKKAGINQLRLYLESGDQDILENIIKKRVDLSKVKEIVDICHRLKIFTEGVFMFGVPGETKESMERSLKFAESMGFNRIVKFIFQPFPNTELYNVCVKNNYLTENYDPKRIYITGDQAYVKTDKFSPEDVIEIVNR